MEKDAAPSPTCEVCGKAQARRDDILCGECSRAYMILLKVLYDYPELAVGDLERVGEVFQWRMRKIGLPQPEAKVTAVPRS